MNESAQTTTDDPEPHAVALFTEDGKAAGVYFCSKCRYVGPSHLVAQTCCAPKICEDCGAKYDRKLGHSNCPSCQAIRWENRLQAKWDAAPKVDGWSWTGPLVTDDQEGSDDGFWHDLDALQDWLEEEGKTLADVRCYATKRDSMRADAVRLIEWMAEDQYEGAYDGIPGEAHAELQAALDAWCDKYGTTSYVEDPSRALVFRERT